MQDEAVLCKITEVFEKAKQCNPARRSARKTHHWSHIKEVNLNPLKEHDPKQKKSKRKIKSSDNYVDKYQSQLKIVIGLRTPVTKLN